MIKLQTELANLKPTCSSHSMMPHELYVIDYVCYRYGQMERAILSSEISGVDLRGAVTRGVGAQGIELSETVRRMEESIPHVIVLLEASVERCINLTGGSEADELILALDDIMIQYISALQETLKSLRAVCGVDQTSESKKDMGFEKKEANQTRKADLVSSEEEWSIVQGALQILTVSDCLTSRSSVFEASLRATLARLSTSFSLSVFGSSLDQKLSHLTISDGTGEPTLGGRAALDAASVRLLDVPEKARKLFNLLEQVQIKVHNFMRTLFFFFSFWPDLEVIYGVDVCTV